MKKRIILVTGAAGFIGSHLTDALVRRKEKVRCLVRKQDDLKYLQKNKVEIFFGDVTNRQTLSKAIKGVDIVYHLAAKTDFSGKTWKSYWFPNVLGTKNVVDLAVKEKVKRLIFFSTIRTIGLKDSKQPRNEKAPYCPLNYYDQSKVEGEKILLKAYKEQRLPITIIRPSSVFGPRDKGTYFSFFKTIAKGRFFLIGDGNNLVSFVYVKHVVQAAIKIIDSEKTIGEIYFINDAKPYYMKNLAKTISMAFGKQLPKFYLPTVIAYIIGFLWAILGKWLKIPVILTPERVKNLTISYVFDISKSIRDFGYNPKIPLTRSITETAKWYKKYGWI